MRRGHVALVVTVLAAGCGPTPEEAAGAVLVALPVVLLVGHLFVRLLTRLWRPLVDPPLSARPVLVAAAVAVAPAIGALVVGGDRVLEWVVAAVWAFGTTYLTLLFVAWRVWLACDAITAGSWSFFAPLSLTLLPGLPLFFDAPSQYGEMIVAGWVFIGYGGMVGGPVLLVLLIEVLVRRHRARLATK